MEPVQRFGGRRWFALLSVLFIWALIGCQPGTGPKASTQPELMTSSENVFKFNVPFERGKAEFAAGDSIVITSVRSTSPDMQSGICCIMGKYTLASRDRAALGAFVAVEKSDWAEPVNSAQCITVQKGSGAFTLLLPISNQGWPHVSFYTSADERRIAILQELVTKLKNQSKARREQILAIAEEYGTDDLTGPYNMKTEEVSRLEQECKEVKAALGIATANGDQAQMAELQKRLEGTVTLYNNQRTEALELGGKALQIRQLEEDEMQITQRKDEAFKQLERMRLESKRFGPSPDGSSFGGVYFGTGNWVVQH